MKRLVRLLMINWYRLEQASIDIVGHTAVIGPNASGKSSLLDAIQAVLVGGDKRWWNPNASAGEKSTRSLRDYCLGVVRDPGNPDLSQEFRPRDQAISYLALVFRDDQTGDTTSIGLALHARLDEPQEVIDGRFIAPAWIWSCRTWWTGPPRAPSPSPGSGCGRSCACASASPSGSTPWWASTSATSASCSPMPGAPWTRTHFLRAFRNAITFAPIRNVSDFVRGHILEERSIQVRSLQQALHHYRDIQTRTREARQREEALALIDRGYQRAEQAEPAGAGLALGRAGGGLQCPGGGAGAPAPDPGATRRRDHQARFTDRGPGPAMAGRRRRPDRGQPPPGRHRPGAATGAPPGRDASGAPDPRRGQPGHRAGPAGPGGRASPARQRRAARGPRPDPGPARPAALTAPR